MVWCSSVSTGSHFIIPSLDVKTSTLDVFFLYCYECVYFPPYGQRNSEHANLLHFPPVLSQWIWFRGRIKLRQVQITHWKAGNAGGSEEIKKKNNETVKNKTPSAMQGSSGRNLESAPRGQKKRESFGDPSTPFLYPCCVCTRLAFLLLRRGNIRSMSRAFICPINALARVKSPRFFYLFYFPCLPSLSFSTRALLISLVCCGRAILIRHCY